MLDLNIRAAVMTCLILLCNFPNMSGTARDCMLTGVGLRVRTSLQRQLFDVARTGEVQAFKSLLRKKRRTAVGDINFQYR